MSIYDYYKKPSRRKIAVFEYWQEYARKHGYEFDVRSATFAQISFVLWNGETTLVVTPTYITTYETPTGKLIVKTPNNIF